jgi:predicted RNA-binding Zn-ribbon protein involved in translation (DUF1610 family)
MGVMPRTAIIDITRNREVVAVCPQCGNELHLPLDWQQMMRESMAPVDAPHWDGVIRCRKGHHLVEMVTIEVTNTIYEADGTAIVHLVTEDREHAVCTGEAWRLGNPEPGTMLRQCQACRHIARGGVR